jgi:hypothetical protein
MFLLVGCQLARIDSFLAREIVTEEMDHLRCMLYIHGGAYYCQSSFSGKR